MKTCPHIFFIPLVSSLLVIQHMPKEITLTHIIPKRRKKHLLAFVGGQHSQIKAFFLRLPCFWQKGLSLEGFTLDDHNTKVYWPTQFRKCLVCPSSQKLLETRDLSVPLPQWCYRGTAKGPAVLCSLCCVQSVSDRVKAASICAPCHYKSGEDNEAALLSRATLPHSDHSTVWWTESPQPFFFSPLFLP